MSAEKQHSIVVVSYYKKNGNIKDNRKVHICMFLKRHKRLGNIENKDRRACKCNVKQRGNLSVMCMLSSLKGQLLSFKEV